jgi:hypothetical protein
MHELVENYLLGDKMALLRSDGEYFIFKESLGKWDNEVWYSNESFRPKPKAKTWHGHGTQQAGSKWWEKTRQAAMKTGSTRESTDTTDMLMENGYYNGLPCSLCSVELDMYDDELCNEVGAVTPLCFECIQEKEDELLDESNIMRGLTWGVTSLDRFHTSLSIVNKGDNDDAN